MKNYNIRAILIPSNNNYNANSARFNAFKYINSKIKYIIYILPLDKLEKSNKCYIYHNDNIISNNEIINNNLNLENVRIRDNLFYWIYPELKYYFPFSRILAIGPNFYSKNLVDFIYNFLIKHNNSLLIATSDLIHYTLEHPKKLILEQPEQLDKIRKEEHFIFELVSKQMNFKNIKNYTFSENIMHGPRVIELFSEIVILLNLKGKVVDYYDSFAIKKYNRDILNKYLISGKKRENFISYVSIIYGKNLNQDIIIDFDITMQIAIFKSIIKNYLNNINYELFGPVWSPFYRLQLGVFLETNIDGYTNSSSGLFESNEYKSTALKIINTSKECIYSAENYFGIPYKKEILDRMNYKIELLQSKDKWKRCSGSDVYNVFNIKSGKYGLLLKLRNGKSATYLPIVSKENPDWSIDKYMESLSKKAIGKSNSKEWINWKKGKIKIYKTTSFLWDSNKQKLLLL